MRGECYGIAGYSYTREAEDVRRSQVKYNGTTVRQYLIAPSAGITCRLDNSVEGYTGLSGWKGMKNDIGKTNC